MRSLLTGAPLRQGRRRAGRLRPGGGAGPGLATLLATGGCEHSPARTTLGGRTHRVDTAKATEVPTVDGSSVGSYPNLIHYDKLDKAGTSRPGTDATVLRGGSRGLPVPSLASAGRQRLHRLPSANAVRSCEKEIPMSASSTRPPTPEGPGSASSSPDAGHGLPRRTFIGGAAAAAAASLGSGLMQPAAASTRPPTPKGPGSVSGAPHLPRGFRRTFTSRYVDVGEVRLHAVTGGEGPPLLLVHGWPQTWYQWRLVMPTLARDFQRGRGRRARHRPVRQTPRRL